MRSEQLGHSFCCNRQKCCRQGGAYSDLEREVVMAKAKRPSSLKAIWLLADADIVVIVSTLTWTCSSKRKKWTRNYR